MSESGLVCELFREYSCLSVTLENLKENDSLHTNLTLLAMIAEKLLIDSCVVSVEITWLYTFTLRCVALFAG